VISSSPMPPPRMNEENTRAAEASVVAVATVVVQPLARAFRKPGAVNVFARDDPCGSDQAIRNSFSLSFVIRCLTRDAPRCCSSVQRPNFSMKPLVSAISSLPSRRLSGRHGHRLDAWKDLSWLCADHQLGGITVDEVRQSDNHPIQ